MNSKETTASQLVFSSLLETSFSLQASKQFRKLPNYIGRLRPITLDEWEKHPLYIEFPRRVQFELRRMTAAGDFDLADILPEKEYDLVMRYFFPVNGKMLRNQRELMGTQKNPQHLRWFLSWPLGRIYRRFHVGKRSLEILKPDLYVYKKMVRYENPKLWTIDNIYQANTETLGTLGAYDPEIFQNLILIPMRRFFPDWKPEVRFLAHKQRKVE